jgi:hypothetical protein
MLAARETTLNNGLQALSDETVAQQSIEAKKRFLARMRQVFRLGSSSVPGWVEALVAGILRTSRRWSRE